MSKLIDLDSFPVCTVLPLLLADKTTKRNIIWATDTYAELGDSYGADREITPMNITGANSEIILPRIEKAVNDQQERTRKHAEVFTPAWICNKMNNYCDAVWFGRQDVFNLEQDGTWTATTEQVVFPKRKKWQHYVDSRRLEITCGEAPYLVTRYDAATGDTIPFNNRIGILDRKLRIVKENSADESEWLKWSFRALQSVYGYEFQGDNLLIARTNLLMTFADAVTDRWQREATIAELQEAAKIIAWNVWQMDGLKGSVPFGTLEEANKQMTIWELLGETCNTVISRPMCRFTDWRGGGSLQYTRRLTRKGKEMKFDFAVGNPPYQDESNGEKRNFAPPVYHAFLDASYQVADCVEMIHPARFLFNAGSTPKAWNEKMLGDPHLKVIYYNPDSSKVFSNTDIKGGIAVTYHDSMHNFGAIVVFSQYPELNSIVNKVAHNKSFSSLSDIILSRTAYRLTDCLHQENPWALSRISKGHDYDMSSNIFSLLPELFYDEEPKDSHEYIRIIGRENSKRITKFIRRDYVKKVETLDYYKVFVAQANGSGMFGEAMSSPIVEEPNVGATETFISIGGFTKRSEAVALEKYIKTKFARAMLSLLKVTQNGNKPVWKFVPLQDFSINSDIDWSATLPQIDCQLYKKYELTSDEVDFIETHVKEMA